MGTKPMYWKLVFALNVLYSKDSLDFSSIFRQELRARCRHKTIFAAVLCEFKIETPASQPEV